jgi:hypothetical protein
VGKQHEPAAAVNTPRKDLARWMSLFKIDEALVAMIESAQEELATNGGELPEQLRTALADYVDAFGEKGGQIGV